MRREIAVESTTLPEGAILSVARVSIISYHKNGDPPTESRPHTEVSAKTDEKVIRMNVADVSPHQLRAYLALTEQEVNKQRGRIASGELKRFHFDSPKDFTQFVQTMAEHKMFMF